MTIAALILQTVLGSFVRANDATSRALRYLARARYLFKILYGNWDHPQMANTEVPRDADG